MSTGLTPMAIANTPPSQLKNPLAAAGLVAGADSGSADAPSFELGKLAGSTSAAHDGSEPRRVSSQRHVHATKSHTATADAANPVLAMLQATDLRQSNTASASHSHAGSGSGSRSASVSATTSPGAATGGATPSAAAANETPSTNADKTSTETSTTNPASAVAAASDVETPTSSLPAQAADPAVATDSADAVSVDKLLTRSMTSARMSGDGKPSRVRDGQVDADPAADSATPNTGDGGTTVAKLTAPAGKAILGVLQAGAFAASGVDGSASVAEMIGDAMRIAAAGTAAIPAKRDAAADAVASTTPDATDEADASAAAPAAGAGAMHGGGPEAAMKPDSSATFTAFMHLLRDAAGTRIDVAAQAANGGGSVQDGVLSALQAQSTGNASALLQSPAPAAATLATAVNSSALAFQPGWQDALGSRVDWLLGQGLQEAKIELHPRELGSIHIHVIVGADGADVRFAATHPDVRHALEASLPKLRELLASDGVALAQAHVGSQFQQASQARSFARPFPMRRSGDGQDGAGQTTATEQTTKRMRVASVSLIDDYA